jgi:methionine-rich copper-binding protein CopC
LNDFAGNPAPSYTASFTTGAAYTGSFTVLSSSPAANATGVAQSTAIVLTFSHPVDPVSLYTSALSVNDSAGSVPSTYSVSGAVLTIQPSYPLAPGPVVVYAYVTDLGGALLSGSFSEEFPVSGGQIDTTLPTVVSVSPANGQTVLYSSAYVELEFSKPMNPYSVNATINGSFGAPQNFAAYANDLTPITLAVVVISNSRIALDFTAPPNTLVTILATSGNTDYAGNHLIPFRTTVRTSSQPTTAASHVVRQSGGSAGLVLYWSAPLDRASVEQNWLVSSSSGAIAGTFAWTADSAGFSFTPSAPMRQQRERLLAASRPRCRRPGDHL